MNRLILRGAAERDIADAFDWYDRQRHTLGGEFLQAVERSLQSIGENPLRYPVRYGGLHRALIKRFPYGIFYRVRPDGVIVVAVLHCARDERLLDGR